MFRKSAYSASLLLVAVIALLVLGIVMLFSTSAYARDTHGNPYFFLERQSVFMVAGVVACVIAALVDYRILRKLWPWLFGLACVLLVLCYTQHKINGAHRWLHLGPVAFQPSELGKFVVIVFLAHWFAKYADETKSFLRGFLYPLLIISVPTLLIAREVDLGSTVLIISVTFVMMFVAGTRAWILFPSLGLGFGGIIGVAMLIPERMARLLAFLHPERYKDGAAWQLMQALIAFGSGGVEGLGLGNGRQKQLYLPEAHTDFIFPMIGEELGLYFTLLVVLCYIAIIGCGTAIAIQAKDRFGQLLAIGFTSLIAFQAAVNIGMTTGLLPNKGLPLPLISYGGSNLFFCLLDIGILFNIYRQGGEAPKPLTARPFQRSLPRI